MNAISRSTLAGGGAGMAALLLLSACGGPVAGSATSSVRGTEAANVNVPGADRFAPFITAVRRGTQVTFHNADHDAHNVTSIPGDTLALDIMLQPGQSETVTVTAAGVHTYFCSIHAHWDPLTGQVAASEGADHPDEPMEGIFVVS